MAEYCDIRIRMVKILSGRARKKAEEMDLCDDDLVIVRTRINSPPEYELEKIEGSPTQYLQDKLLVAD